MIKYLLLTSLTLLFFLSGCKKDEEETKPTTPYSLSNSWGDLGTGNNQLNKPKKIVATKDFVFINDAGNSMVKKFDHTGKFIAALDYSSPFYIYKNNFYILSDTNKHVLQKRDLNFKLVQSFGFDSSITQVSDISGNDKQCIIAKYGREEPFLMGLNFSNLSQRDLGLLGTGKLAFQPNGSFFVAYEDGNNSLDPRYFVTDGGNKRVQVLDTNLNFVTAFGTSGGDRSVLNSPNVISSNDIYIAVSNSNNGGDEIDFYNRENNGYQFTHNIGGSFKESVSFYDNKFFVLLSYPEVKVHVYTK